MSAVSTSPAPQSPAAGSSSNSSPSPPRRLTATEAYHLRLLGNPAPPDDLGPNAQPHIQWKKELLDIAVFDKHDRVSIFASKLKAFER